MILKVEHLSKSFGPVKAVQNISFSFDRGGIIGMLGPNGAGKTTLIRLIMDIYKPDSGSIELAAELAGKNRKNHIGYLPEERGLYTKEKVGNTLAYFARLKGLDKKAANQRVTEFLERMNMTHTRNMKIMKLSKGNQQKIQLIGSIISMPDLLILDEPFSGLDPINTRLVIDVLSELKEKGVSIVLSTHQMDRVENLCDRIMLVNQGHLLLNGPTQEIIASFSGSFWMIQSESLPESELFTHVSSEHNRHKISLNEGVTIHQLMMEIGANGWPVESIQPFRRPLSDIFIQVVEEANHGQN